jgi:hypothetical protein
VFFQVRKACAAKQAFRRRNSGELWRSCGRPQRLVGIAASRIRTPLPCVMQRVNFTFVVLYR